jgi:hypothetical protein
MKPARRSYRLILFCLLGIASSLLATPGAAAELTENDLTTLLKLGIAETAVLSRVEQAGLGFTVDEAALTRLKEAGASETLLQGLRKAGEAKPAGTSGTPISYDDVLQLLKLQIDETAILKRLEQSPTVFSLSAAQIAELQQTGATDKLIAALRQPRPASAQAAELISDVAIVLDCSGSMKESTTEGDTKMDAAKRVVTDLIGKLPDNLNVAFVIYGHEARGPANDPANCQAVKVARPLSPLGKSAKGELAALIGGLRPVGATPIALSLRTAGEELARNDSYCGLILITDGLETCQGDPAAEAATLARNPKLSFGVNVIGFDVKAEERAVLADIASQGRGKYLNAENAAQLTDSINQIYEDLDKRVRPPDSAPVARRAVKVLAPTIEMPPMAEIVLIEAGMPIKESRLYKKGSISQYGEELRIPSSTAKYDLVWYPKEGEGIQIVKELMLPERKLVELRLEELVGLIRVSGTGQAKSIHAAEAGAPAVLSFSTQRARTFGEVMVVPVGTYDVYVDGNLIEEGLEVTAGKLHDLQ